MKASRTEQGSALLVTLAFLGAISILASAFVATVHQSVTGQRLEWETATAEQLAEAALARGVAGLLSNGDSYDGELHIPFAEGRYSIEVEKVSNDSTYTLIGTGEMMLDNVVARRVALRAHLRIQNGSVVEIVQTRVKP